MRDLKDVEKALVNEDLNQAKNICIDYAKICHGSRRIDVAEM